MVAPLEQLRQDIIRLETKTAEIASELRNCLESYCEVLRTSVQRQLILASFHLCTQTYPEEFLRLSFSDRGQLQTQLQQLGVQLANELTLACQLILTADADARVAPDVLLERWESIEDKIVDTLRLYSRKVNEQFQTHGILQIASLGKLLEVAAKAEESGRSITNPPLLLKALMDVRESEDLSPEPLVALYLQLSDLEFSDPELMKWRQKLRPLIQNLTQTHQLYAQKQEDLLVAEATAAWRSSWVACHEPEGGGAALP